MSQALVERGYKQAKKLLLIQAVIVLLVASLGLFKDLKVAIALLSGGAGAVLANAFFVYQAFSKSGAQSSKKVVRAFYFGETVKIILSAVLIAAVFWLLPGYEIYALAGFIIALLSQWLAPVIVKTH